MMEEEAIDSLAWFTAWPHDKVSVMDKWCEVHFRYGLAAQKATELETDLVLLLVDIDVKSKRKYRFEDSIALITHYSQDIRLLGRLIAILKTKAKLSEDFEEELATALSKRNYLVHHFYRVRSAFFYTPSGCDELIDEVVEIKDHIEIASDSLHEVTEQLIGPKLGLDDMLNFIQKHGTEYGLTDAAFMANYRAMSLKILEQINKAFRNRK